MDQRPDAFGSIDPTDACDKVVLVGEMFDARKGRFTIAGEWRGEVVGGRGKSVHFELGEALGGKVGE